MTYKFCKTFPGMARKSDFLKGCKTFKKETLKIHGESQKHKGIVVKGLTWRNMTQQKISKLGFPERGKYWTFNIKTGLQKRTLNFKTLIKSLKEYLFLLFYRLSLATNYFYFGHWNLSLAARFLELVANWPPKLKSYFEAWHVCQMFSSTSKTDSYNWIMA